MTEMVVAVPISMIISGAGYSRSAATAATIRSLPICAGLSIWMLSPVLMPGPTTMGFFPVSFMTAVRNELSSGGTTEEMMTPSRSEIWISPSESTFFRSMQYWSDVLT